MTSLYPAETNSGAVTVWIPLTTTFTPSPSCTSQFRLDGPSLVAFDPGYGLDINPAAACAPPAVTTWWEQGRLGAGNAQAHTAASLGPMTCPDEWTTVDSSVKDRSSTLEMCCPSGYTLANGIQGSVVGDCESAVSSGQVLTFASTPSDQSAAWTVTKTTLANRSIVGAIAVVGWNIAAATPTAKASRSSALSSSPTSTSPLTAATSSSSRGSVPTASAGLSTGAAVGVGLGVALGFIGIAALLVALWLVRRRKRREAAVEAAAAAAGNNNTDNPNPPYPPVEHAPKPFQAHELPPSDITPELDAHDAVRPPPVELDGS
ncbi:hypothetical protein QBC46DRAFT_125153 [Diplogelasinospora grovesii]|uniref:Uncharacterized protein n=1 Tax=Diplogelasinospora grovesii TaxID=303347 RepID=A0AAN6NA52_9PEZI|nr:hypothetical protein QBC46DRAFT_125153 [Diplogelasinospora grovesii]